MVECSPATRAARVRFPADALIFLYSFAETDIGTMPTLVAGNLRSIDVINAAVLIIHQQMN